MPKSECLARLGWRIKKLRTAKKMTQEDLEEASGLDRTYISDIERGNRNPSYTGLMKLAQGLNTSLAEMLMEIDDEKID